MTTTSKPVDQAKSYKIEYKDDVGSTHTSTYTPGSDAEKALVRKLDMRIVPVIWVLYFLSYLVRCYSDPV